MRALEPSRVDDLALAILLLLIGAPRAVLAILYDRPITGEGVLSLGCVILAFAILLRRSTWRRAELPPS